MEMEIQVITTIFHLFIIKVRSQLVPYINWAGNSVTNLYKLYFEALVPPLGYSIYYLNESVQGTFQSSVRAVELQAKPISIQNSVYKLEFDPNTGFLSQVTNFLSGNVSSSISHNYIFYDGSHDDVYRYLEHMI